MDLLVLGVILCGLFFWGQYHKDIKIIWPAVLIAFLTGVTLCVISRPWLQEADTPSVIGACFVMGTAFYAIWSRFLRKKL